MRGLASALALAGAFALGCSGGEFHSGSDGSSGKSGSSGASSGGGGAGQGGGGTRACTPETVELIAVADANLLNYSPDSNQGREPWLLVANHSSEDFTYRALVRFDLESVSAASTIVSARLELIRRYSAAEQANVQVNRVQQDPPRPWHEDYATWNEYTRAMPWTVPGGDFDPNQTAEARMSGFTTGALVSWDVLEDALDFHRNPETNFGWSLQAFPRLTSSDNVTFQAREPATDPIVTTVPPPTLVLGVCSE